MSEVVLLYPVRGTQEFVPYALLYLKDELKARGHMVEIIDFQLGYRAQREFKKALLKKPDVLGISIFLGEAVTVAEKAVAQCRRLSPSTRIIWGGVFPSMYPVQALDSPNIDYIVRFEGEKSFPRLIEALEQGIPKPEIPNIGWKEGGDVVLQPRSPLLNLLEALPIQFSGISCRHYTKKGENLPCQRAVSFFSSRGCPNSCKFCYNHFYNQGRWRAFSVEWVVDGVERLTQTFSADGLYFLDDNFWVDKNRAKKILQGIRDRGIDLVYWWEMCIDQIIKLNINELKEFYDLGLRALFIGVESGTDTLLQEIGKGFKTDDVRKANKMLLECGVNAHYSFMIGLPGETREDTLRTADLVMELFDANPTASIWQINKYVLFPEVRFDHEIIEDPSAPRPRYQVSGITPWLRSSNRTYQCMIYAGIFLKDDEFIKNSPFLNRVLLTLFRPMFAFRMRRHFFFPFIDTWLINWVLKIQALSARTKSW